MTPNGTTPVIFAPGTLTTAFSRVIIAVFTLLTKVMQSRQSRKRDFTSRMARCAHQSFLQPVRASMDLLQPIKRGLATF